MATSTAKPVIKKEGYPRKILGNDGKVVAEEVGCLGTCNGTFIRRGKQLGNFSIRKCAICQGRAKKQSGWAKNWGNTVMKLSN